MKAKYFNNESILKCKVPKQFSWMWQSLMDSRDLVQEGTRRKVGNGRSINIWNDGWIPGNKDGRVQIDKPPNCDVSKVEHLIRGFRWNRYVIFSTFNKKDAERSCRYLLACQGERTATIGYIVKLVNTL